MAKKAPIHRVRAICMGLPEVSEKLSHGEPTFFARKRVFCMFSNNHHHDGHVAVWIPAAPGAQAMLIKEDPKKYYKPPYVGVGGWVGVELAEATDDELGAHIHEAWKLMMDKQRSTKRKPSLP